MRKEIKLAARCFALVYCIVVASLAFVDLVLYGPQAALDTIITFSIPIAAAALLYGAACFVYALVFMAAVLLWAACSTIAEEFAEIRDRRGF